MANKRLSLGLDLSTQSISAVLVDIDSREIVYQYSLDYQKDARLKKYGIQGQNYILPPKNEGEANQPPKMFLAALEALFTDMKSAGLPMRDILVCNTSAQQHSHAYMSRQCTYDFWQTEYTRQHKIKPGDNIGRLFFSEYCPHMDDLRHY